MEEHSTVQLRRDTVGEDVTANGTALGRDEGTQQPHLSHLSHLSSSLSFTSDVCSLESV